MKRIGIYIFYDAQGIVDQYVGHFLAHINKHLERLVIVVNGVLTEESQDYLKQYSDEIIIRENSDFEVGAYKAGLEYIGFDNLSNYDELLMANNTFFGPIDSFDTMFDDMAVKTLDFWGITKHPAIKKTISGISLTYMEEHLQSYFLVFKAPVIHSDDFKYFWDTRPPIRSHEECVDFFEIILTPYLAKKGFSYGAYVDDNALKLIRNPILFSSYELITEYKCPIVKRKVFVENNFSKFLACTNGDNASKTYDFLRQHTNYNIDFIWDNILRTTNMRDIYQNLQLNYILPYDQTNEIKRISSKVCAVLHIYHKDEVDYCLDKLKNLPNYCDILITTSSKDMLNFIQSIMINSEIKAEVIQIPNRGRDIASLLVGAREFILKYDIVCFCHDKKTGQFKPPLGGKSYRNHCFDNILGSQEYVQNILTLFEKNPKLGLLSPSFPAFGDFIKLMGREWTSNFNNSKTFLEKFGINTIIDEKKSPIAPFGSMFWFRVDALKTLYDINLSYNDFPEEPLPNDGAISHTLERIFPIIAQSRLYYSAYVLSTESAKSDICNLQYTVRSYNKISPHLRYRLPPLKLIVRSLKRKAKRLLKEKLR